MPKLPRIAVFAALKIALLLTASPGFAQETLLATKLFDTAAGERQGLAYEPATDRLYTIERATTLVAPQLRAYTLAGSLVSGPHLLDETSGGLTQMGLHFLRADASFAGGTASAGSLVYLRDGTLYTLDKSDGSVIDEEVVDPDFDTGGLCTSPLAGGGKGLGYSTQLQVFLSTNSCCNCAGVVELIDGAVTGFIPITVPGTAGGGGVEEHPTAGSLWVAHAPVSNGISVFSSQRVLLREFEVVDDDTLDAVTVMRLAFDATGDTLWLLGFDGAVYAIDTADASPASVPALGPAAALLLLLALGGAAVGLRRDRPASGP